MAHQRADTKTLMLSVIEEYSHSDMALGPQIRSMHHDDDDAVENTLLIMAHAHIHSAIALLKAAGETQQQVAEDLYIHADIQGREGNIMTSREIDKALAVVRELIRNRQLTVVVETPEGSNCCPVVSANLNGNNIDVWLDEKFGNEITTKNLSTRTP